MKDIQKALIRLNKKLPEAKIASMLGVNQSTVHRIKVGTTKNVSYDLANRIIKLEEKING